MARAKKKSKPVKSRKPTAKKPRAVAVTAVTSAGTQNEVVETLPALQAVAAIELPECLDSSAAEHLKTLFLSMRGRPIEVDASQVRRVGAQSLQVLISATRTWKVDGHDYRLINMSSELTGSVALLGLNGAELSIAGTCQ